jgi:hypothetical protein
MGAHVEGIGDGESGDCRRGEREIMIQEKPHELMWKESGMVRAVIASVGISKEAGGEMDIINPLMPSKLLDHIGSKTTSPR